jgi:cellulose synthase operon protein C
MKRRALAGALALVLASPAASAVPVEKPSAAAEPSRMKAAAERSIGGGGLQKPKGAPGPGQSTATGPGSRPAIRGPKIPEALREKLRVQLDRRIEKDIVGIRGLRLEAIGLLTTFVGETPKESREMPEALMRLGELKWELEREQFVDRFKVWEGKPVDQRGPAPEPNFTPSRELFGRVLKDYPSFGQYDLVLYVDGFLATEQGKQDEAIERFSRILRDFPQSRFVPDAHMARAEALFNGKYDYAGALKEYEEVLKFKNSELYGLALFKSAWCYWRLNNTDEAAKRFVSVFEVTDTQGKTASASQRKQLDELQSEALKYLVEIFTEDEKNTAGDMYNFLVKVGGDKFAGKVVKALAETFYDQSHYERGIEAYELLLKLEPTSREAGTYVLQIAAGYAALEDYPKLKATYDRALAQYTQGGSWTRTQADAANVAATQAAIEKQLREHALQLHGKAQRDKTSRAEYEGAAGLYDTYLTKFGGEAKAYEVHYNLAEIDFYHLDKNTDAGTHYMAAARQMPDAQAKSEPLKTLRHDAIYNAIAALERVRLQELEARKGKPTAVQETETDKKFAEALELYAQLYPTDPALPELLFRQGKLYYDYAVYGTAVKIWSSLLEKFPQSPYTEGAGELVLDALNRSKDYENIETYARKVKTLPRFQSATQQARLDTFIVQAVFKQGEQKSQAGDHAAAASAYLRAAKEFPRDARAAQACVNAELESQKAGDVATLKEAAQLVTGKDYRDKPESPQGAWAAATTFQAMGLFADAAEFHEAIAQLSDREHPNYQKFEHAKDAGYNAVILREATGDHDRAVEDGKKFLTAYGSSAEADEVVFQMGRAHQNAGRNKEAVDLYKRYLAKAKNQDHRAQGYVLLAQAQLKVNDDKGAESSLEAAVSIGKHKKAELGADGKYAAAHARYMEGERVLAKFETIQIGGDVKQLSLRLKQKAELLKQASTIFLDTVSLGVAEWSTAALYQIGHTYEAFAKSMRDAPPPPNLSEADKELYTSQIEEFVVPIEEKSLDAYENGWRRAVDIGIYNQWTAKMREALGRLNGELYPPFKEVGFDVRSQGPTAFPPLFDAPRRGVPAPAEPPPKFVVPPAAPAKKPGGRK